MSAIRALLFDLDGTAIPNSPEGMPSARVVDAVKQAQAKIIVACATGRELTIARPIIEAFQLTAPCIVAGGSQIIDPTAWLPLWQEVITAAQLRQIQSVAQAFPYLMGAVDDPGPEKPIAEYDYFFDKPIVYILNVPREESDKLAVKLAEVPGIAVHQVTAWTPGNVDFHITSELASKSHAMQIWLQRASLQESEVMVVGDSNNDLPLFAHAGLKIAMSNGTNELKKRADWIAPHVKDDGLALAIEKFIQ